MVSIELMQARAREEMAFAAAGISAELNVDAMRKVMADTGNEIPERTRFQVINRGDLRATWVIPPSVDDLNSQIVYVHGGGFVAGGLDSHRALVAWLAAECGAPILFVHYPLAPEQCYPSQINRAIEAIALARTELPSGPGRVDRLWLASDSAGGAIAMAAMQRLRDDKAQLPDAAVVFCGMIELDETQSLVLQSSARRGAMVAAYLGTMANQASKLSPLSSALRGLPRMLFQTGTEDGCMEDIKRCVEIARAEEVRVKLTIVDGAFHAWQRFAPIAPEAMSALKEAAEFFRCDG